MIGTTPPKVSVVLPTKNEAANLPHVLPRIPHWVHEVVLVDGHSTDGTIEIARALWPNDHVVTQERRRRWHERHPLAGERRGPGMVLRLLSQEGRGKGAALRIGFAAATGDIIITLDADGSTDPGEIAAFVGALLSGAHFVKGSRFLQGGGTGDMSFSRRWGNSFFVTIVNLLFRCRYSDLCYGYNAFWSWVPPVLQPTGDGFEIETMMNVRALQAGLKVAEIPSFEHPRVSGASNLRAIPDGWRVLRTIWREWASPTVRAPAAQPIETPEQAATAGAPFAPILWTPGARATEPDPGVHDGTAILP